MRKKSKFFPNYLGLFVLSFGGMGAFLPSSVVAAVVGSTDEFVDLNVSDDRNLLQLEVHCGDVTVHRVNGDALNLPREFDDHLAVGTRGNIIVSKRGAVRQISLANSLKLLNAKLFSIFFLHF